MSDVAIRVENLGKLYKIGKRERYYTLRDSLADFFTRPFRRRNGGPPSENNGEDQFWALKDVSLEIKSGEVVGIIGRNGAGKTTLLKILSRITEPTTGRAEIHGRVGSLLEVGTGFHPELTGRENIYLNAAILGMRKAEIARKFDEIVAFAEVEKFLDTPVKHYSSGMYVRLAFAVAAHLEPEILLVDEVLAVGDAAFQKKCLGKMSDVAQEGRTVLFVSHNMGVIAQICKYSLLLESGYLVFEGDTQTSINKYLSSDMVDSLSICTDLTNYNKRSGIGGGKIIKVELENKYKENIHTIGIGEPLNIKIYVHIINIRSSVVLGLEIKSHSGIHILNLRSDSMGIFFGPYAENSNIIFNFKIPSIPLYPGKYILEPWFGEKKGKRIDHIHNAISVQLEPIGNFKSEMMIQKGRGFLMMDFECKDYILLSSELDKISNKVAITQT